MWRRVGASGASIDIFIRAAFQEFWNRPVMSLDTQGHPTRMASRNLGANWAQFFFWPPSCQPVLALKRFKWDDITPVTQAVQVTYNYREISAEKIYNWLSGFSCRALRHTLQSLLQYQWHANDGPAMACYGLLQVVAGQKITKKWTLPRSSPHLVTSS